MASRKTLRCGPAGWSYPHWEGLVYPQAKPRGYHVLDQLADLFDTVEVNTSFYRFLKPEITRLWMNKVSHNRDFVFTAKLHRRFTHDRVLDPVEIESFKEGLLPMLRAKKLGCLLMQFPWNFRFTAENRDFFIKLRRAFHDFPLVAEMRHGSWMLEEAIGTFIDYRVGFCNIDQPGYTKAMPPTSLLTSAIAYVRLHGRNPKNALGELSESAARSTQHDYLYSQTELDEWVDRVNHFRQHADSVFVITNNDVNAKSVVNALQLQSNLGSTRRIAPGGLIRRYPEHLAGFHSSGYQQASLFAA